jgi:hypothetical protein
VRGIECSLNAETTSMGVSGTSGCGQKRCGRGVTEVESHEVGSVWGATGNFVPWQHIPCVLCCSTAVGNGTLPGSASSSCDKSPIMRMCVLELLQICCSLQCMCTCSERLALLRPPQGLQSSVVCTLGQEL